jgi:hypothetical protein
MREEALGAVKAGRRPRNGRNAFDLGRDIEFSTYALHCARSDFGGESIRERLPYMRRKHTTRMHDSYPL